MIVDPRAAPRGPKRRADVALLQHCGPRIAPARTSARKRKHRGGKGASVGATLRKIPHRTRKTGDINGGAEPPAENSAPALTGSAAAKLIARRESGAAERRDRIGGDEARLERETDAVG
jgi:hypothetical protein